MSMKSEAIKSASYLRNARKAVVERGGEISPTAGLKDLPNAIYNIPPESSLAYQVDDGAAYRKIVPVGADEFAFVSKVGGMSHKCPVTNYLKITGDEYDKLNENYSINSDGSITIYSSDSDTTIKGSVKFNFDFEAPPGDYYFFATGDDISYGVTVQITGEWFDEDANGWDGMVFELGSRVDGSYQFSELIVDFGEGDGGYGYGTPVTFKLWLAKTTEGIFEGLRDTKVTELVSEGANLIPYPFPYKETTLTRAGITFTDNGDGSITLNGKNDGTNHSSFRISNRPSQPLHLKAGTYIGSTGVEAVSICLYNGSTYPTLYSGCTLESDEDWQVYIQVAKNNATVFENTVVYPMMNYGMTAAPYKPYRAEAVDAFTIPAEIQAIDGYGRGVEGYPNYIDFERKVFVQNTYRKVFDGTEGWGLAIAVPQGQSDTGLRRIHLNIADRPAKQIDVRTVAPMICNLYNADTMENTYYCIDSTCSCSNTHLYIYDARFNSADSLSAWKAHLAELCENGNPLIVEYTLAEPIEVDISAYLSTNTFVTVEGGGALTFKNEYGQAAPSTIIYLFEAGEGVNE